MRDLTVIRCGTSPRMDRLLERLAPSLTAGDGPENETAKSLLLFAVSVDEYGPDREYVDLCRRVRGGDYRGCFAGVIVVGETELDTKAVGRELIFWLNRAGCAFPERPLVEATGSMRNLRITQRRLGLSEPEDALLAAAEALLERMRHHVPPRFEAPRLLVLHASDHKTSNSA